MQCCRFLVGDGPPSADCKGQERGERESELEVSELEVADQAAFT